MMLVETFVGPSTIEGVGVFAAVPIRAGTCVWVLEPTFDRIVPCDAVEKMPVEVQKFIERYAYRNPKFEGAWILEMDNGRFMNHSANANLEYGPQMISTARRDIRVGEELTCDYNQIEPGFQLLPPASISAVAAMNNGKQRRRHLSIVE